MGWVRLDDAIAMHPKLVPLSDSAFRLFIASICYANRLLTDGEIKSKMVSALAPNLAEPDRAAAELKAAGLWHKARNGNWLIHDYRDYQPSSDDVRARLTRDRARKSTGIPRGFRGLAGAQTQPNPTKDPPPPPQGGAPAGSIDLQGGTARLRDPPLSIGADPRPSDPRRKASRHLRQGHHRRASRRLGPPALPRTRRPPAMSPRDPEQPRRAGEKGHRHMIVRADLRRHVRMASDPPTHRLRLAQLLITKPPELATLKAYDLIRWIPRMTEYQAIGLLTEADASAFVTVGNLTKRQRLLLYRALTDGSAPRIVDGPPDMG